MPSQEPSSADDMRVRTNFVLIWDLSEINSFNFQSIPGDLSIAEDEDLFQDQAKDPEPASDKDPEPARDKSPEPARDKSPEPIPNGAHVREQSPQPGPSSQTSGFPSPAHYQGQSQESAEDEDETGESSSSDDDEDDAPKRLYVPRMNRAVRQPKDDLLESDDDDPPRTKAYKRFRRLMNIQEPPKNDIKTSSLKFPDLDHLRPGEIVKLIAKYQSTFHIPLLGVVPGQNRRKKFRKPMLMSVPSIPDSRSSIQSEPPRSDIDDIDEIELAATINEKLPKDGFTSREALEEAFSDRDYSTAALLDARLNYVENDLGMELLKKYLGPTGQYALKWNKDGHGPEHLPKVFVDFIMKAWRHRKAQALKVTEEQADNLIKKQMTYYVTNGRNRYRKTLIPFMQEHYPHLISGFLERNTQCPTREEYNTNKEKLLETKAEEDIGIFEPYPEEIRPIGDEKILLEMISFEKAKNQQEFERLEELLVAGLTEEELEIRQKRIAPRWTQAMRETRVEKRINKKEEAAKKSSKKSKDKSKDRKDKSKDKEQSEKDTPGKSKSSKKRNRDDSSSDTGKKHKKSKNKDKEDDK